MSFTRLYSGQWRGIRLEAEGLSKDYLRLLRLRLRGVEAKLLASDWYWEGKLLVKQLMPQTETKRGKLLGKQLMPACLGGQGHFLYTCRGVQNSRSFCKVPGTSTDVLANRIIERENWNKAVSAKECSGTWKKKQLLFLSLLKFSTPSFYF